MLRLSHFVLSVLQTLHYVLYRLYRLRMLDGFTKLISMQVLGSDDAVAVNQNSMGDGRNTIEFGSFALPAFHVGDVAPGQMIIFDGF